MQGTLICSKNKDIKEKHLILYQMNSSFFFPFHLNDTLQCTHPTLEIAFPLKKVELAGFSSSYSQPKYKLLYFFKGTSTDSGFSTFLTYEKDPYHFCH